ncbi:MAG: YhbY family RNA-binding protein [Holophagaceae bacterium]
MLTSKQRQFLKAQAHKLKPVMHVGKGGVTAAQAAELDVMVDSLELVKIKINQNSLEDEATAAKALCALVPGLEHVWTIGHTMLFFRPSRTHDTRYPLPA